MSAQATILYNEFENYTYKITATFLRGKELGLSWGLDWMHFGTESSVVCKMFYPIFSMQPSSKPILIYHP